MHNCILHLGSNVGFPQYNLELAEVLVWNYIGEIKTKSKLYQTAPWGYHDQSDFLNCAYWVLTDKSAEEVLSEAQMIEQRMGREKTLKWGPRLIDIDIIFFDEQIIENDNLIIPHPEITNRNFVLVPLMDICPDWIHPTKAKTIRAILNECKDQSQVTLWIDGEN